MNGNMKKEAVARLAFLVGQGLDSAILSGYDRENLVFFSDHLDKTSAVHGEVRQCEELRQAVDEVEREYPVHVYYVALSQRGLARVAAMLFVEEDPGEWEYSRSCLEQGFPCAFAYDLDAQWTEVGDIRYRLIDGCLVRTV